MGNPAVFGISGATGLLIITRDGIAGEFSVPVSLKAPATNPKVSFTGTLSLAINTATTEVNETFLLPGIESDGQDNDGDGSTTNPVKRKF